MGKSERRSIHWFQIQIGLLVLLIGVFVYLADRPPGDTYFVSRSPFGISLYQVFPGFFGSIGRNLPAFAHAFAFIVITAGWMACDKKGYGIIALGWFLVDGAFEIGQRHGTIVMEYVPGWFNGIPFLENTQNFFRRGTFDWMDLLAVLAGSISAYVFLIITRNRKFV